MFKLFKKKDDELEDVPPQQSSYQGKKSFGEFRPTHGSTPQSFGQQAPVQSGTNYHEMIENHLRSVAKKGLGYITFSDALKTLEGQPLPEQTKYVVTFPTYQSQGVTPQDLENSAIDSIQAMTGMQSEFERELLHEREVNVTSKRQLVEQKTKEIQDATNLINSLTQEVQRLTTEADQKELTLNAESVAFGNAISWKQQQINDHISKIKTYLNVTPTTTVK